MAEARRRGRPARATRCARWTGRSRRGRRGARPGPAARHRRRPRPSSSRALDDDFGTPEAFAALFEMVRGGQPGDRRRAPRAPPSCARRATSWSSCSTCSAWPGSTAAAGRGARRGHGPAAPPRGGARRPRLRRAPTRCATAIRDAGLRDHRHRRRARRSTRRERRPPADGREVVYGRNPVRELLAAGRAAGARGVGARRSCAAEPWLAGVRGASSAPATSSARLAGTGDHQGVVAFADPYPYAEPARPPRAPGRRRVPRRRPGPAQPRRDRARGRGVGRGRPRHPAPREPRA